MREAQLAETVAGGGEARHRPTRQPVAPAPAATA
jgi:hypothetical protein